MHALRMFSSSHDAALPPWPGHVAASRRHRHDAFQLMAVFKTMQAAHTSGAVQSSHQGSATPGQAPTPGSIKQQGGSARQSRSRAAAAEGAAEPDFKQGRTSARLTRKLDFDGRSAPLLPSTVSHAACLCLPPAEVARGWP